MRPWKPLRQRPPQWWILQGVGYTHAAVSGWLWGSVPHWWCVANALVGLAWFLYADSRWAWPDMPAPGKGEGT